jgi:hypothetical protein
MRNDERRIGVEYETKCKVDSRKKKQKGSGVSVEKEAVRLLRVYRRSWFASGHEDVAQKLVNQTGSNDVRPVRRLYINPFSLGGSSPKSSDKDRNLYPS